MENNILEDLLTKLESGEAFAEILDRVIVREIGSIFKETLNRAVIEHGLNRAEVEHIVSVYSDELEKLRINLQDIAMSPQSDDHGDDRSSDEDASNENPPA